MYFISKCISSRISALRTLKVLKKIKINFHIKYIPIPQEKHISKHSL